MGMVTVGGLLTTTCSFDLILRPSAVLLAEFGGSMFSKLLYFVTRSCMSCSSSSLSTVWPFRLPTMYLESLCPRCKQTASIIDEVHIPFDASAVIHYIQRQAR